MVVVGGATRLTGSGLSITEWRPVSGALPPLTAHDWDFAFRLYRATPQFRLLNPEMTLAQFRFIFWWEWSHRLLGRIAGAAFGLPFLAFLATRSLPRRLTLPCAGLLTLGGLQGAVGWWMVKSGLEDRVSVAPERLAIHLGLALFLLGALVWTALEAWNGPRAATAPRRWSAFAAGLVALAFLQCLLGALLAGNHGGLVDADWPLMAGRLFPSDYWQGGWWASFAHGQAASQFDHRLGAYLLFAGTIAAALSAPRPTRRLVSVVALAVTAQAALGIATLRAGDPLALAIIHQAGAAAVLTLTVALLWHASRVGAVTR